MLANDDAESTVFESPHLQERRLARSWGSPCWRKRFYPWHCATGRPAWLWRHGGHGLPASETSRSPALLGREDSRQKTGAINRQDEPSTLDPFSSDFW